MLDVIINILKGDIQVVEINIIAVFCFTLFCGIVSYYGAKLTNYLIEKGKQIKLYSILLFIFFCLMVFYDELDSMKDIMIDKLLLAKLGNSNNAKKILKFIYVASSAFSALIGLLLWGYRKHTSEELKKREGYLNTWEASIEGREDELASQRDKLIKSIKFWVGEKRKIVTGSQKYEILKKQLIQRIKDNKNHILRCDECKNDSVVSLSGMFNIIPKPLDNTITRLFASSNMVRKNGLVCIDKFAKSVAKYGIILDKHADNYVKHVEEIMDDLEKRAEGSWEYFITCLFPPEWFFNEDDEILPPHERGISADIVKAFGDTLVNSKLECLHNLILPMFNRAINANDEGGDSGIKKVQGHRFIILDDHDRDRIIFDKNKMADSNKSFNDYEKSFNEFKKCALRLERINDPMKHRYAWTKDISQHVGDKVSREFINEIDFIAFAKKPKDGGDLNFEYVVMYNMGGQFMRVLWWGNGEASGDNNNYIFDSVNALWNEYKDKKNSPKLIEFCNNIQIKCNYQL